MLDLTLEKNQSKEIERVVEGYSESEKLVVRIAGRYLEIRTYQSRNGPRLRIPWTRIHRNAIELELEIARRMKKGPAANVSVRRGTQETLL